MNIERLQKRFRKYFRTNNDDDGTVINTDVVQVINKRPNQKQTNYNHRQPQKEVLNNNVQPFNAILVQQNCQQYPPNIPNYNTNAVGLTNIGSTCYMSSVLQSIIRQPTLIAQLCQMQINRSVLAQQLLRISNLLLTNQQVPPEELRRFKQIIEQINPMFSGSSQQDSSELLQLILNTIHEDLKGESNYKDFSFTDESLMGQQIAEYLRHQDYYNQSLIAKLFRIEYLVGFVCKTCQTRKYNFENTLTLDLVLPTDIATIPLTQLLNQIDSHIQLQCTRCNRQRDMLKKIKIIRAPQLLIVNLRRYMKSNLVDRLFNNQTFVKNTLNIQLDVVLDLQSISCFVDKTKYYLNAFIDHKGTQNNGHYTSYVFENEWHFFNDLVVQRCHLDMIYNILRNNQSVYTLIYKLY